MSLHEEKKALLASLKSMYEWVLRRENTFLTAHGQVNQKREVNAEVGKRFDAYLERLSHFVEAPERTEDEKIR